MSAQVLYQSPTFSVTADRVREGKWEARAVSRTELQSNYDPAGKSSDIRRWKLSEDVSSYPQLRSDHVLVDALYNLSLEELKKDIRSDGAFMAGAKWEGVWTRDISYSILLSLAIIEPEAAKKSLLEKVARDRIIQDTGTGGSWPCSTDRMVWALAAWEIYLANGDEDWLSRAFIIIRNSAADDAEVVFSRQTGLVLGESSFLDWREQTYPKWMTPADIYSSQALGTNAVHFQTYRILSQMARILGQPADAYEATANRIKDAMNRHLWLEQNGFYGQYLYGWNAMSVSPRPEALGEALTILFDIASEKQQPQILRAIPVMAYGIPCVYPQTPGIPPYHNNAVWPFVQAFWNLAAAKRHEGAALKQGMAAIYRAAALFLTNQENLVASTGAAQGTEINSPRQLWSVAGNLAMIYRVIFGISMEPGGLRLNPVIPDSFGGTATLDNFHYRDATLSFSIEGHGSKVQSVTMDGTPLDIASSAPTIPADIDGKHTVRIVMANDSLPENGLRLSAPSVAPETPAVSRDSAILHWGAVPGVTSYVVARNGEKIADTAKTSFTLPVAAGYAEYQVSAIGQNGAHSFLSYPVRADDSTGILVEAEGLAPISPEKATGFTGKGFIELSGAINRSVTITAEVHETGTYAVDFRYANGSGPINTDNKCAIRQLAVDGKPQGAIVFPQRGKDEWSNWGYSSRLQLALAAGKHEFRLQFDPADENMNGAVNRAWVDHLRLMRIYDSAATGTSGHQ